jgi:hypothetical protein
MRGQDQGWGSKRCARKEHLILIRFIALTTILAGLGSDFFVVLLEGGKILTGFGELTFFHTLSDVPVDEGTLGVHKVELVVEAGEYFGDGGRVGDHADGALYLGKVATRDDGRRLVVDTALETGRAPVNELNGTLGLDGGNSGVDVLGDDITTEHQATGHVFTVARITLGHHGGRLEGRVGDFSNGELFMVSLFGGDDRGVRRDHKVDTRVRHQVGLELSNINVEGTIETKRSSQRRDNLRDQSVKVGVGRALNVKRTTADVIDSFVIKDNVHISVLEKRVSRQDAIVRLDNSGGDLRSGVDSETKLGFLTIVHRETLKEKRSETRTSTTTNGVEDQETLKTSAVISELADTVEGEVNNFFTNGVVTTGVVVGSIFFTRDQLFGVEELTVGTSADFVNDGRLQIEEDSTRNVFASTSFREKGVEGIVTTTDGFIGRHLAIRLNTVLEAVKFPASITDLDTGLTNVKGDNFSHD